MERSVKVDVVARCERRPLCGEPEFAALVEGLVADVAPRVFALVEEQGEREDGWVFAWGLAFEERACVVRESGGLVESFESAACAHETYARRRTLRLVWCGGEVA